MNTERYEELLERWNDNDNPLSEEEADELLEMIYDKVEAGENLIGIELSIIMEDDRVDTEILEVGRKGWVAMRGIYKIRGRYWAIDYWDNDMCGWDCEEQVVQEVVEKEVVRKVWSFVKEELNHV
jgi:hypothetical protein